MKLYNILDEMFGNKTKVRLLRAFFTFPEKGFTESELERIAGIPQASVHRNVKSLMVNGLLDRKRILLGSLPFERYEIESKLK